MKLATNLKVFLLLFIPLVGMAQTSKIKIIHSNQTYRDQKQYPGAMVLNGDVQVEHQGALLTCKKALFYQLENRLYAYGDVFINQADTLTQKSDHLQYDGDSQKALSWGKVVVKDKEITLTTDTLHFNRVTQVLKYDCFGTIVNLENTLTSQIGEYFANDKKLTARQNVKVVNPDMNLTTGHMDYYTTTGKTYLYGPSTIINKESELYTERGIYDTRLSLGYLLKNSIIYHESNEIEGDSLYYNKLKAFASGTGNLIITDTVNKIIVTGDYGEVYRDKDSIIVTKRPLAISTVEKDSMFIHGDTLSITGPENNKLMKVFHHVKIFKSDLSGKCDSLVTHQGKGITELFTNPVLWSGSNQITGDSIRLINNLETNKLDSLNIIKNALIVQKDSVGYNQIKGKNMFGKFVEQKLTSLLAKGNGAVVNYARNENAELTAIMDMECSNILFNLKENKIQDIMFLKKPDGKTYPPEKFPEDRKLIKGFIWRGTERPLKKEDIFIHD
ncbi:OstA-like protein [Wenyingzhuangia aestuarii]|uniref:OstA-like protein n=1 Tax=Wenyingzhuangia aestuarii TaxID=1647582 RepID=UPI00143BA812|nr:OstA-like protein [Wenyingzhuangia aestuarii]NJB82279.1 lipopolysaccharide export system protein LptA [Wenyingzhuangia aestuarii]